MSDISRKTRHSRMRLPRYGDIQPEEGLRRVLEQSGLTPRAVNHVMDWYTDSRRELGELRGRVDRVERALRLLAGSLHGLSELIKDLIPVMEESICVH